MNKEQTAQHIDHTLLAATASRVEIAKLCSEAAEYGFKAVCVNSFWVDYASELLKSDNVKVATVIGFPLGAMSTEGKTAEALAAVKAGADELDIVINVGLIKSGEWDAVAADLTAVIKTAKNEDSSIVTKVIIETGLLTDDEKVKATEIVIAAGSDYVKTCTGFNEGHATVEDVSMMVSLGAKHVKASGGVRTLAALKDMVAAGADRIGTSNGVAIIKEFDNVENTASTVY